MANTSLDFGADNGADDGLGGTINRYFTLPAPALPNGDWAICCWFRQDHDWPGRKYAYSYRDAGDSPSVGLSLLSGDSSHWIKDNNGDGPGPLIFVGDWTTGENIFFCVQRRGLNLEFYVIPKGATVSVPTDSVPHGFTAGFDAGTWRFGGADGFGQFQNPLGEFAICNNASLSIAQINAAVAGVHLSTILSVAVDLRFRTSLATEPNLGTGGATHNATRFGTGWATAAEFFADSVADSTAPSLNSGPTLTNIVSGGFDISGTPDEGGTASLIYLSDVNAGQPTNAAFDASSETAAMTASTPFTIHHTGG